MTPRGAVREVGSAESGLLLYLDRPKTPEQMLDKWRRFAASTTRVIPVGEAVSYVDGQRGVADEVVEDLCWMLGTKPCGICPTGSHEPGGRTACRKHRPLTQVQIAMRLLERKDDNAPYGYRVSRRRKETP